MSNTGDRETCRTEVNARMSVEEEELLIVVEGRSGSEKTISTAIDNSAPVASAILAAIRPLPLSLESKLATPANAVIRPVEMTLLQTGSFQISLRIDTPFPLLSAGLIQGCPNILARDFEIPPR